MAPTLTGVSLVFPLHRLPEEPESSQPVARLLHLDAHRHDGLQDWAAQVRDAAEACLLVDRDGRVAAMSGAAGDLLLLDAKASVGALLVDLVSLVDFTATGVPVDDPATALPPLRSLVQQRHQRSLVRTRSGHRTTTYDMVGVPLHGGIGALGFLTAV